MLIVSMKSTCTELINLHPIVTRETLCRMASLLPIPVKSTDYPLKSMELSILNL